MKLLRTLLTALALLLPAAAAEAQSVTVIGPITPGNCTKFFSTTQVSDAGAPCGSGGGGGSGTVTSVGLALPVSTFSISGSPVTVSGTLTGTFLNQSANTVFAGPSSGPAATPTWRALTNADLPLLNPADGGTGISNPTAHSLLVTEGSAIFNLIGPITAGRFIVDQGPGLDFANVAMSGDCVLAGSGAITCTKTNGVAFGTFATANAATPPAIGGTTPAAGAFTTLTASTPIGLTSGGTNASLTASNGGVVYSTASSFAILAGTVTAGQCLLSGSSAAPTWGSCSGASAVSSVSNSDGTLTFSPTTGAVVGSLALGHANTWTAAQTFTNSDIILLGSSTGATTFTSANAGASNFTATVPANTGTLAETNLAQTWTAAQTHNSGTLLVAGATSGTLTINCVAICGSSVVTFPANTGTVAELNLAQTWSAAQNFNSSDLLVNGATSGAITLNCVATCGSNTATFPSNTGTVAELNLAQTWTAAQTFNASDLKVAGATSGSLTINCAAICGSNTITFPAGTTDFSATGGSGFFLKQSSAGAAITVAAISASDLTGAGAGSDTQVIYNSGGSFAGSTGFVFDKTSKITLGVSGTSVGGVVLNNATSGSITIAPATGALGSVTATLPANTGTIAETNLAQTFSANQTFSAQSIHTGTSAPASAAGNTVVMGTIAAPTLTNTGQAFLFNTVAGGAILQGDGSTNDITINNKSGGAVCTVATGGTTINCATLTLTNDLTIANGGTGASTQQAALNAIAPTPSANPGDIIYWNGTNWVNLPGNTTGNQLLQETALGVPSWVTVSGSGTVTSVTCGNVTITSSGFCPPLLPQGRLTLTSGVPVMTANAASTSIVYYDCYKGGNLVPTYNGTNDVVLPIPSCEISMTMATTGTGVTNNAGVFDVWAVNVSGTLAICVATNGSGGGWASDTAGSNTARGTGYSQLDLTTRPYITNKNSITNCYTGTTQRGAISANRATLLGTLTTTAAGKTVMTFSAGAAGGGGNVLGLFNAYNREPVIATSADTTASWTYATASWHQADGTSGNQIVYVDGLGIMTIDASYQVFISTSTASGADVGMSRDSTTGTPVLAASLYKTGSTITNGSVNTVGNFLPSIGLHTIVAQEAVQAGTQTFYGSGWAIGGANEQALRISVMM